MTDTAQPTSQTTTSNFAATHCRNCAGGMAIDWLDGRQASYCILLRDWTTDEQGRSRLAGCNRYERAET